MVVSGGAIPFITNRFIPKGGVVVAIRQQMGVPVKYVGLGEQVDDLELFSPDDFVDALFADE